MKTIYCRGQVGFTSIIINKKIKKAKEEKEKTFAKVFIYNVSELMYGEITKVGQDGGSDINNKVCLKYLKDILENQGQLFSIKQRKREERGENQPNIINDF